MSQLNVQVEQLSPVIHRISVEVPAERVGQVTESLLLRLSRTAQVRGYRAGKVPRAVLQRQFGDQLRADTVRGAVESTLTEALDQVKLQPVAEPALELGDLRPGEAFSYTARVEVRPTVSLSRYKELEVSFREERADDAAVTAELERLREAMSTLVNVEGRDSVEMGDVAEASYTMGFPGTGREPVTREGAMVRVQTGKFIDGFGEKLAGMKVGESRSFFEAFEGEGVPEELKGRSAEISITVKAIKRNEKPVLDDEFARDQGSDSLEALQGRIRTDLEARAAESNVSSRRMALIEQLVAENPFEVPPSLVDDAAGNMAKRFIDSMGFGAKGDFRDAILETYRNELRGRAELEVKSFFVLDAVADAEEIKVSPEDLDARFEAIAAQRQESVARVKEQYARSYEALSRLIAGIRNERALSIVESSARFSAVEAAPEAA